MAASKHPTRNGPWTILLTYGWGLSGPGPAGSGQNQSKDYANSSANDWALMTTLYRDISKSSLLFPTSWMLISKLKFPEDERRSQEWGLVQGTAKKSTDIDFADPRTVITHWNGKRGNFLVFFLGLEWMDSKQKQILKQLLILKEVWAQNPVISLKLQVRWGFPCIACVSRSKDKSTAGQTFSVDDFLAENILPRGKKMKNKKKKKIKQLTKLKL